MNIIYIHTHDTGRYIEPYGYDVSTPHLMEFAREGTLFRNAFCAAPTCSPSRAALLTGMSPHSSGMLGLAHRGFALNDYQQHLVNHLNNNGYETALCGVQHVAKYDKIKEQIGYDKIITSKENTDLHNAESAAEYIKNTGDNPFFLSMGMVNTHREYPELDDSINQEYVKTPEPIFDTEATRKDMARYKLSVQKVDKCVGKVINALKDCGKYEDSLVLFTTDHGLAFPFMKCNLFDSGIGISLIMKQPFQNDSGKAVDSLISQIDIFPTICDIAKIEQPSWLEGKSFLPVLENEKEEIREEIFAEVTFHAAYEPMRCIRTKRYKYIKLFFDHHDIVPANIDDSYTKSFLLDKGLLERKREHEQLYDLYFDPNERNNLIEDNDYQKVYQDLKKRLNSWMEKTDDPLLKGYVEKPEGARVNKKSCISPTENDFE
ncbi:MAG: sulfatase [Halanaerobiaceae bacterium]